MPSSWVTWSSSLEETQISDTSSCHHVQKSKLYELINQYKNPCIFFSNRKKKKIIIITISKNHQDFMSIKLHTSSNQQSLKINLYVYIDKKKS